MIYKVVCDNIPRKGFNNAYEPFKEKPPVKIQRFSSICRKMKKNWTAKGEEIFIVEYTEDSPSDCYNAVKKSYGRVMASRDIKWSNPYRKTTKDPRELEVAPTRGLLQRNTLTLPCLRSPIQKTAMTLSISLRPQATTKTMIPVMVPLLNKSA